MIFKMLDCDFGFSHDGGSGVVNYEFTEVENLQLEDPERTRLIRGSNGGNKTGLIYKEGIKEAKRLTLTVIGMTKAVHDLLKEIYKDKDRVDCYCVDRVSGSTKIAKNAVLCSEPQQLSLDETAESMNTALIFESFDVSEVHTV